MMSDESWGRRVIFHCGHAAYVLGEHNYDDHCHYCPVCDGTNDCGIEYMDVHNDGPTEEEQKFVWAQILRSWNGVY